MPEEPRDNVFGRLAKPRRTLTSRSDAAPQGEAAPAPPEPPAASEPTAPEPQPQAESPPKRSRKRSPSKTKVQTNYKGGGLYTFQGADAKKLVAYVSPEAHRSVKVAAADLGVTMSEIVDRAIRAAGYGATTT